MTTGNPCGNYQDLPPRSEPLGQSSICRWLAPVTGLLEPLYQAAKKVPFESKVIGTDDTGVKVLVCADLADLWLRVANFAQGLLLNPGDYTVKIVPTTGSPVVQDVKLEANKTVLVK